MTNDVQHEENPGGWLFWLSLLIGWCVMAFGLWTMLHNSGPDNPRYSFKLAFGFNVVHDAVVAPIACAVGYIVSRLVPGRIRAQVGWGLFASAIVVVIGYIPFRGYGSHSDNPSVQPLNYTTALLTVLGVVWVIVLLLIFASLLRHRIRSRPTQRDVPSE